MNLFYLDQNLDRCAEYHIDKHVGRMQLEASQLLATALWIDRIFGYVPRALNSEEFTELRNGQRKEPPIEERKFLRYLATHYNHPCNIWVRSSLENFYWTVCYVNALDSENVWRGNSSHASCGVANSMSEPKHMKDVGFTPPAQAMPIELQQEDPVSAYRTFYMLDKAPFATWKKRGKPEWWNDDVALREKRYTDLTIAERRKLGTL